MAEGKVQPLPHIQVFLRRSPNTEAALFAFKSWTKFVWRSVRNSSAPVHVLTHITVAFKTRKIIENTPGPVHDLRAARQKLSSVVRKLVARELSFVRLFFIQPNEALLDESLDELRSSAKARVPVASAGRIVGVGLRVFRVQPMEAVTTCRVFELTFSPEPIKFLREPLLIKRAVVIDLFAECCARQSQRCPRSSGPL
jgi:hypothetical protein